MDKYQKDFRRWAEVAEDVEKFTRPVLVLGKLSERMVLAVPTTSKEHRGGNYVEIVVAGKLESLALMHFAVIDTLRLGDFVDEISPTALNVIRNRFLRLLKRYFYEKE